MTANTFPQKFDNFLDSIQSILMSFLVKLGPFFVALMPALFSAYAIFHTFKTEASQGLAFFFAVVVGLAMETVGIVATHTAIDLYNAKDEGTIQPVKFWLMFWLVPVYVIGVASVVYFSEDAFTPLVKGLGIASPFLTCIVYIAVALARDISKTEFRQATSDDRQEKINTEEREWQRQRELVELQYKQDAKLARIEAKKVSNQTVNQDVKHVKNGSFDAVNLSKEQRKIELLDSMIDIYIDTPLVGVSAVAKSLNVSRQSVYNYQNELQEAGKLHRNGEGWKVTQ